MTMLNEKQIDTASNLIREVNRWRYMRSVAQEATSIVVHIQAPSTVNTMKSSSSFQWSSSSGTQMADVSMEAERFDPIKAAVIEQLDAQIAAGEAELAKLGVTAD